jgi:hypothetical protein
VPAASFHAPNLGDRRRIRKNPGAGRGGTLGHLLPAGLTITLQGRPGSGGVATNATPTTPQECRGGQSTPKPRGGSGSGSNSPGSTSCARRTPVTIISIGPLIPIPTTCCLWFARCRRPVSRAWRTSPRR